MIVEKRADGRVETEATIKIWVDGERYVRTAEGNGPVHALDRALRARDHRDHPHLRDIELVNFKVRILDETQGPERGHPRAHRRLRRRATTWGSIGVSENLIEASWHALVDSLEYGMQPRRAPAARARAGRRSRDGGPRSPAPCLGDEEERLVLEVLRSGQLSLGPRVPAFEEAFAARLGVATPAPSRAGPPGFTSRCARSA